MNPIDIKILEFIDEHHVLTLACSQDEQPYVANCFYVFDKVNNCFYFTSDPETRHAKNIIHNSKVAASIVLETNAIGKIQGLQLTGIAEMLSSKNDSHAKLMYLKAFPYAILKLETMWKVEVNYYKLTDNRLGFGKKIIWEKE